MESAERIPMGHLLWALGLAGVALSCVFPWAESSIGERSRQVGPLATASLRPSAVFLLLTMAVGLAISRGTSGPALTAVGIAAELWALFATIFWWIGTRMPVLVSGDIFEDAALVAPEPGASLGMAGGVFVVLAIFHETAGSLLPPHLPRSVPRANALVLAALLGLLLWSRHLPWIRIGRDENTHDLGIDAALVVGEFFALLTLGLAVALIAAALRPSALLGAATAAGGFALALAAATARLVGSTVVWGVERSSGRVEALQGISGSVRQRYGSLVTAVSGVLAMAFGLFTYARSRAR